MSLRRVLILIILMLLLQSCASVGMGEQYEQGKRSFVNGNYKQALHELLPTAVYGNAKAQYGVGFIYYNGYEVPQDTESGIFWMTMSAKQGYAPAKLALAEIQKENLLKAAKRHQTTGCDVSATVPSSAVKVKMLPTYKGDTIFEERPVLRPLVKTSSAVKASKNDEVLQSLISDQLLHEVKKNPALGILARKDTVNLPEPKSVYTEKKSNFTLQVFGSYHKEEVRKLQAQLSSSKLTRCWHAKREGKDWFVLTYGEFRTAHAAKSALTSLPGAIREMNPWVRPLAQLELA